MDLQTWIALVAVAASVVYFAWTTVAEFQGAEKCASGCGSCGAKTCPTKLLERRLPRRA